MKIRNCLISEFSSTAAKGPLLQLVVVWLRKPLGMLIFRFKVHFKHYYGCHSRGHFSHCYCGFSPTNICQDVRFLTACVQSRYMWEKWALYIVTKGDIHKWHSLFRVHWREQRLQSLNCFYTAMDIRLHTVTK